jgi:hypothetical protein
MVSMMVLKYREPRKLHPRPAGKKGPGGERHDHEEEESLELRILENATKRG